MVVPLNEPAAGRAAAVLAKRKVEAGAAEAAAQSGQAIRQARGAGDMPAGGCGARHGGGAMADQQAQAGDAGADALALAI